MGSGLLSKGFSGKTEDFCPGEGRKILYLDELDASTLAGIVLDMLVFICKDGGTNVVAIFKKKICKIIVQSTKLQPLEKY